MLQNAKPDPEPIYKALDALGSSPEEAIMVGDNYHDILAGKNAGTKTVGVAWSTKGKRYLQAFEPDYMLEKMTDLFNHCWSSEANEKNGTVILLKEPIPYGMSIKPCHFGRLIKNFIVIQLARYTSFSWLEKLALSTFFTDESGRTNLICLNGHA